MGDELKGASRSENGRLRLSYSALGMLRRCGEQFRYRYVEGSKRPPGIAARVGTGTHKGVEADLTEKIATGELLPDDAVAEAARDGFDAAWAEGIHLTPEERERDLATLKGAGIDQAVELALLHHTELAPKIQPAAVEEWWHVETDGPFDLSGVIDVREVDGRVRDTKTSGKTPAKNAAHISQQLTMYAMARHVHGEALPVPVALDTLVKLKTPKPDVQLSTRTADDLARHERRIQVAFDVVEAGAYLPADPDDWVCSERWCGWFSQCSFANRPVSVGGGTGPAVTPKTRARAKRSG